MSARVLFQCKPLSLSVVAAITMLSASPAETLLLPPKPLALSSSWDCRATANNDWLCRNSQHSDYDQPLENISRQRDYLDISTYQPGPQTDQYSAPRPTRPLPVQKPGPVQESDYYQQPITPQYSMPAQESMFSRRIQEPAPDDRPYQSTVTPSAEGIGLNRLLNSPHGSYVLQWQAAHSPQPLRELQKQFPVLKEATIVQYQRNGKFWYVLLDGPFKNRQVATNALQSSPRADMMNRLYPWTRSIASIQKLDLVHPDRIMSNPAYERTAMVREYNDPATEVQGTDRMFASISPAYPNMEQPVQYPSVYDERVFQPRDQYQPRYERPAASTSYRNNHQEVDYNDPGERRQTTYQPRRKPRQKQNMTLDATPGSYTIQWMASHRKETLERVQKRYAYLGDTQIIQYRKRGKDWYVLISKTYDSQYLARRALEQPTFARIATRLYPRIRSVDSLRQLADAQKASVRKQLAKNKSAPGILDDQKNGYTIQWFAANRPDAIKKMKQRFPELAAAVTVHYRRNQKDWYVLLQGQFDSSSEALDLLKSPVMKDAVQVLHPWTRPMNSLKNLGIQES